MTLTYKTEDGIFAKIAGGHGSAVFLIRLSSSYELILKACAALGINKTKLKPNVSFTQNIYTKGEFLDKALICYFKAPGSFTGEDCLEIGIHASKFIFEEVSRALIEVGFRFASNGEFSYRAFLNGKIDLVEAEGIASLIASASKIQHLAAKRQFLGQASDVFNKIRNLVLDVMSLIESLIDFSDEDLPAQVSKDLLKKVEDVKNVLKSHLQNSSIISLQDGLKIAIIGRPNVGKSSIFNRFCKQERAIVSKTAGTTRDILEERIILSGVPVIFYDTAGIRNSTDEIEVEGIKRAIKTLQKSDIKLLVSSAIEPCSFNELASEFGFSIDQNTILVLNKIDEAADVKQDGVLCVSAKTGEGFTDLLGEIERILESNFLPLINEGLIATERQKHCIESALLHLERFNLNKEIELASEDLRIASNFLYEITGKIDVEDILGSIFSKFCIGK